MTKDFWLGKPRLSMVNGAWMCKCENPYGTVPFVGVAKTPITAFDDLKRSIRFRLESKGYMNVVFFT